MWLSYSFYDAYFALYEYFDIAYQVGQARTFKEDPKKCLNFYLKEAKNKY